MNKKINYLLFCLFLISSTSISAQKDSSNYSPTARGKLMLGGNARVEFQKYKNDPSQKISATLSPRIAYFVLKNFAIGLNVNYSYESLNKGQAMRDEVAIGALLRYYLRFKKHGIFVEVSGQYGKSKTNYSYTDPYSYYSNGQYTFEQIMPGGGYCYFLNKNVSVEALYLYQIRKSSFLTLPNKKRSQTVLIGFQFYF